MRSYIAIHCGMLPSHPTLWLHKVLLMAAWNLLLIFGTVEAIVSALKIRFAELPVHSKMYYKSYYDQMTAEEILNTIIIGENGELDPSGLQQDRLGMTPLHILACSLSSVLSCINSLWTRVSCQLDC